MSLKKNIVANFAGSAWSALMGLIFLPFYIRLMGVESYGIVGVFVSLMGMLAVLDLGLSQAMNREMARLSSEKQMGHCMTDTARTLEIIYWCVALIIGGGIILLANPIVNYWLNLEQLTKADLQQTFWIMGLVIALRWPVALYMGGLNGLQKQVQLNILLCIFATVQGVGALAVLWFISPTIHFFFMWQAIVALAQVITLRIALWNNLSSSRKATFNIKILKDIWRFAAGISGISLLTTILTQLDKILLSKILSLSEFGYYTFAATVAAVILRLIGPIFTAYYPRLTALVSKGDQSKLTNTYHQACQLMAVAVLPSTFILVLFSNEILKGWTGDSNMILHTSLLISLLAIGNALNGLVTTPYALQLAHGWTKLAFVQNIVALVILAPAIYFSTLRWGATGAAAVWIILNLGYILISIQLMHRRILKREKWNWYLYDVIIPLLAIAPLTVIARLIIGPSTGKLTTIFVLLLTLFIATITAIATSNSLPKKLSLYQLWGKKI